jgi:methylglutaconyl-CoA hydratase
MFKTIIVNKENQVLTVWLNRPEAKNAFNPQMVEELVALCNEIKTDSESKVIVFRGKNNQFCSGADIPWMKNSGMVSDDQNMRESHRISDLLTSIRSIRKPTIGLAQGGVFGGAVGLLSVLDWVIADKKCKFGLPEVHLGIAPAVIWPYVLMRISANNALQLAQTGKPFDSEMAMKIGLVDKISEDQNIESDLHELIHDLIIPSNEAQMELKRLHQTVQQNPSEGVIRKTIEILSKLKKSENGQEGLKAFIEKRKPEWK